MEREVQAVIDAHLRESQDVDRLLIDVLNAAIRLARARREVLAVADRALRQTHPFHVPVPPPPPQPYRSPDGYDFTPDGRPYRRN